MFFATWLSEVANLKSELAGLNAYVTAARGAGLPAAGGGGRDGGRAIGPVRPYVTLAGLGTKLHFEVGLDTTGRVADGYQVQDQPWFALVSAVRQDHPGRTTAGFRCPPCKPPSRSTRGDP